jgi:di- and tripeptidase
MIIGIDCFEKELFQDIDMILLSNSYWLGEDVPCLTYGLRGVIRASLTVNCIPCH